MNCPTCAYDMRAHGTDTITHPDGGLSLADLYFCGACCLWHHIAVTDPTEQITRLTTLTDTLLTNATQVEERYTEFLEDVRHAEIGRVRVACRNCDGEYYTHHTDISPYFCTRCESAGFRSVYLTSPKDVCWTCDTNRRDADHNCVSCRFWTTNLRKPDALIIDGHLYFVGPEPATTDLIADPKRYGCYGTGFVIGHADGTQTTTHNLGSCGEIPIGFQPADNAAFLDIMPTPEWRFSYPIRTTTGASR